MFIVLVLRALENFPDHKRKYWLLPFQVLEVIFTCYLIDFWTFKCGACLIVEPKETFISDEQSVSEHNITNIT